MPVSPLCTRRAAPKAPEGKKDLLNATPILGSILLLPRISPRPVLCKLLEQRWILSRIFLHVQIYVTPFCILFALAQDMIHHETTLYFIYSGLIWKGRVY